MGIFWSTNSNRRRDNSYYHNPPIPPHSYYTTDAVSLPAPVPPPLLAPPPQNNYYPTPHGSSGVASPYPYPTPPMQPPPPLPPHFNTYYPQQTYIYGGQVSGGWWPNVSVRPGVVGPHTVPTMEPAPYVEHQNAKKVRNDVNVHKDKLKVEVDDENPDRHLLSFVFDAEVDGCITIMYFAKEEPNCRFSPLFPQVYVPIKVPFQRGIGQKFCQPSGTGINLSFFEFDDLSKPSGNEDIFPLVIVAESHNSDHSDNHYGNGLMSNTPGNMQITQAVFEKKGSDAVHVKVIKQILYINGVSYEMRDIYGIRSSSSEGFNDSDPGKECVICMTEPKDTAVLPCRHMCLCSDCAKALSMQSNKCPICRQPIEKLIEIKISNDPR